MVDDFANVETQFDRSEKDYRAAKAIWLEVWNRAALNSVGKWLTPWHKDIPGWLEGNPLFSAISRERRAALRVIVHPPTDSSEEALSYWIDSREDEDGNQLRELVIDCVFSRQSLLLAEQLITAWVSGRFELVSPLEPIATMSSVTLSGLQSRGRIAA